MRRAIRSRHRHAVRVARAADKFVVRRVARVSPDASRGDAEFSETVAARHAGLRCEQRQAVHIGGRQTAACRQHGIRFSQARCAGARDHRRIVGARDRHDHGLRRCGALVIGHRHGELLTVAIACGQTLLRLVVQCVSPHPGAGVDREAAVGADQVAAVAGRRAMVHITRCDAAGGGEQNVFLDRAGLRRTGDDRCVIAARDRHVHSRRFDIPGSICDGVGECISGALADSQIVVETSGRCVDETGARRGGRGRVGGS